MCGMCHKYYKNFIQNTDNLNVFMLVIFNVETIIQSQKYTFECQLNTPVKTQ